MDSQKKWINLLLFAEVIVLVVVFVFGSFTKVTSSFKSNTEQNKQSESTVQDNAEADQNGNKDENVVPTEVSIERLNFSEQVEAKLSEMTLEEKVAQMFLITPESLTGVEDVVNAGETSKAAIQTYPVGGLEFTTDNYQDSVQFSEMISGFQEYSQERTGINLFIAVKEAGGSDYSPFAAEGLYEMQPSASELGAAGDTGAARQAAANIAKGLGGYGVNMNLTLVADIAAGNNEEYDILSFGSDAGIVSDMVTSQIAGYHSGDMTAVVRSFPGYSYAQNNNEGSGILINKRTLDEMRTNELMVYQAAIDAGVEAIMIANMTAEGLTGDDKIPCSFSGATTNLLRNDMGYTGLIISGDLSNDRITAQYDAATAAIASVKAGMDVIYNPSDFVTAYNAVISAVQSGEINENLISNAVGRILSLKYE